MADPRVTDEQVSDFRRFLTLLPRGQDLTLIILKGHLLIEEQVWKVISSRLKKPKALRDGRIESHQAICIAEAFCPEDDDLWQSAKKLNKIRNDIAHNVIPPAGLNDRIDDFVDSVGWLDTTITERQDKFELALWALFIAISSLVKDTATRERSDSSE
ncbi:hypothetical protein E0H72_21015 [Rhizobium leguminosarum bv. viciae]|uniref:hypothetical protein n=1 Tax=Rhizobium leguminosarum TaxID=384 RepID=UPI0006893782|nr:hypothetical protein [Rhizobium leguminosarum]TCA40284.1 hypothetical protein E0H72_21015 [Rhizobium leguminosarum bv. viciae]